jgi:type II secretory pathway pseudopilin PulG
MPVMRARRQRQGGFTLAEIAIAFLIVALLIGGTVLTYTAQSEAREVADTQRTLEQAREALIGFALRNGRLPCPATLGPGGSNGAESFCTNATGACGLAVLVPPNPAPAHGRCTPAAAFVPAAALGIGPIETNPASPNFGLLVDSWLQPVRYAVTQTDVTPPPAAPSNVMLFTAPNAMKANILAAPPVVPDLIVCTQSAGSNAAGAAPAFLPTCAGPGFQAPAIVFSTGKAHGPVGAVGADEVENLDNDRVFVSRPPTPINAGLPAPNPSFDDLVIWVSPNILYNRMIAAGAL